MILSFYSYKGGVGRTQLVANLAAYFCFRKQQKVLLIDWDLDAPGLHYYFDVMNEKINKGLIDLFGEYVEKVKNNTEIDESALPKITSEYIVPVTQTENKHGKIDLLPAGSYGKNFNKKINAFNWYEFYDMLDGKIYIEYFKEQLNLSDYDYVFIDSRTGISDYSGICNIQLPDANFIVVSTAKQDFEGALRITESIIKSPYIQQGFRKAMIFPILSRVDLSIEHKSEEWIEKFGNQFEAFIQNISEFLLTSADDYVRDTILDYKRDISFGEQVLFHGETKQISSKTLAIQYQRIANYIELYKTRIEQQNGTLVKLILTGTEKSKTISDITALISSKKFEIKSIHVKTETGSFTAETQFLIRPDEENKMTELFDDLKNLKNVHEISQRISGEYNWAKHNKTIKNQIAGTQENYEL